MKNKLKIIDSILLRKIYNQTSFEKNSFLCKNLTYISTNPLIRYIWWKRFQIMISLINTNIHKKVLDLGCGEGVFLPTLSSIYNDVDAVDIDVRTAIEIKKHYKLKNVNIFCDNILNTNLLDNSYDLIIAASFLEHFNDLNIVLNAIKKILNKGGTFVFSIPNENILYKIGKYVTGYQKYDHKIHQHYLSKAEIFMKVNHKLKFISKRAVPSLILPLHTCYLFKNE